MVKPQCHSPTHGHWPQLRSSDGSTIARRAWEPRLLTKNVVASPDGSKLYVSVGSNSNVAESGIDQEKGRASIWEIDPRTGDHRVYAFGLRNPVGMALEPERRALWASVNERDGLGSDLVHDCVTSVRDGGFYGWPYSYYGAHVDTRVSPRRPDLVAKAVVPDYAFGPHTASLGLASSAGAALPERYANGMFVGQHGSWNRNPPSGYKVVFVPFAGGRPSGPPTDVLTGFLDRDGNAMRRPVGVPSTGSVRCSSPRTSATSSGASPAATRPVKRSVIERADDGSRGHWLSSASAVRSGASEILMNPV